MRATSRGQCELPTYKFSSLRFVRSWLREREREEEELDGTKSVNAIWNESESRTCNDTHGSTTSIMTLQSRPTSSESAPSILIFQTCSELIS